MDESTVVEAADMGPDEQFPPPGAPGPPGRPDPSAAPLPGWDQGRRPAWGPPPAGAPRPGPPPAGYATGAAHKPGAVPLRPLRVGDMYDAAFKIIRFNPRATVGSAVLVAAVAMSVPVLVTTVLTFTLDLSLGLDPATQAAQPLPDAADLIGLAVALGSLLLGAVAQSIGLVFVTAMIAHVALAATVGRRLSLGEAWRATHGTRWRLVGLVVLIGLAWSVALGVYALTWVVLVVVAGEPLVLLLWGLLTVPAFVALAVWGYVRVTYLAVPALMIERVGVLGALGRAVALTRAQFWRTLGIGLLTALITQVGASVLTVPLAVVSQLSLLVPALGGYQVLVFVVTQALSTVVAAAFVSPFTASVTSLQYVDQRMRKEAYDVELMASTGLTGA